MDRQFKRHNGVVIMGAGVLQVSVNLEKWDDKKLWVRALRALPHQDTSLNTLGTFARKSNFGKAGERDTE